MTDIKLYFKNEVLTGVESRGHSGFREKGEDIVCAAVSSLMNALILGLVEVAKINELEGEIDPEVPVMKIFWPIKKLKKLEKFEEAKKAESIDILTRTIALSLKKLAEDELYGKHVNITEVKL